jgi:membrane protein implicated in regulation of membrane protease activity
MKMAPGLFWGVLLVLIGLAAIFRVVFDVNLFGVLFAFFLIFVGVSLLLGKPWMMKHRQKGENDILFEERAIHDQPRDNTEYNVIFGKSVYDFRDLNFPDNQPVKIKINTIFGQTLIRIRKSTSVKIKSDAVFASAAMPDGNSVAFGSIQYATDSFAVNLNHLYIDAPVVFGSIQVIADE